MAKLVYFLPAKTVKPPSRASAAIYMLLAGILVSLVSAAAAGLFVWS
ncbi:hypothetical protein GQS40_11905|uniref:Uncharacterized protein n=1 Tax=Leuconostoc lactis TaxID=1246 RepID=A0A6L7ABA8_LEULA|nr:hypothetical protein [Leuconostoc lactis]